MKIDAMTGGSIAFAAFAAWYVLRKQTGTRTGTGNANTDTLFGMNKSQRDEVGGALNQNTEQLNKYFSLENDFGNRSGAGFGFGFF